MKKVLLIVLVLAICVLAFPQGVLADTKSEDVTVYASLENFIEFTPHNDLSPAVWALSFVSGDPLGDYWNTEPEALSFDVKTNDPWVLKVTGDNAGKFYSGGSSGGDELLNELTISDHNGVYGDVYPERTITADPTPAGNHVGFTRGLQQLLDYADKPHSDYQEILTFNCANSLP